MVREFKKIRMCVATILCCSALPALTQEIHSVFFAEAARHTFLGNVKDSIAANENGYQQYFENGAIFYLDSAFEVHGLILGKYEQLLGPWGYLGFPRSDELICKDGDGRYSDFQYGSVYYHPTYGTFQVMGSLLAKWRSQGAESGTLGYPIAGPVVTDTGVGQQFQNGFLSVKCKTVDMRDHMYSLGMRVRNQSWRGTCSVFALTCLLEYAYAQLLGGEWVDLSEEYMNHVANLASGEKDDGSCFAPVVSGYESYGVVPESDLPYDLSKQYDFATFVLSDATIAKGRSVLTTPLKLKAVVIKPGCPSPSSMGLSSGQMDTIFTELNKGNPVAVGRGHSLVIAGYVQDATMAGGGFFIIRNSYGPDADDHGYRYENINHLKTYVYDANAYEMPAGVAFGKVLRGRVVGNGGKGIANARVEISGSTAQYGTFTRYDSTDGNGNFCIPKIISLASGITATVNDSVGTLTSAVVLGTDTTTHDFSHVSTANTAQQTPYAQRAMSVTAQRDRNGTITISFSTCTESKGVLRIYGLDGKLLFTNEILQNVGSISVPFDGSNHAVLLYAVAFGKSAATRSGVVRLQW